MSIILAIVPPLCPQEKPPWESDFELEAWNFNRSGTKLAAIENFIAKVSHRQDGVVGSARRLHCDAGIFHLTDEDRVITLFDRIDQHTLNKRRRFFQNRRAQTPFAKRLAADGITFALERLEESKHLPFFTLTG